MSRVEGRSGFDAPTRLRLLEADADELESKYEKINERLGKIMATCVAILTALVGSLILLALNLASGG
jgi:ABC-type enterochelin transport system permease subunit